MLKRNQPSRQRDGMEKLDVYLTLNTVVENPRRKTQVSCKMNNSTAT